MAAIGPGTLNLIIVLSIGSWPLFARYARSIMMSLRNQVFIEAARVAGGKEIAIMTRHVLPNILSPLVTLTTLELSRIVLTEASLSYLGMGVRPPTPAWGLMVQEAHDYLMIANWAVTTPGVFIMITTLSITHLCDPVENFYRPASARKALMSEPTIVSTTSGPKANSAERPLLSIKDLNVEFTVGKNTVHAVNGLSLDLRKGETLAIVGESGSGKSVSMLSVLGLIPQPPGKITNGHVIYDDKDLLFLPSGELRKIRGKEISMIFQDPMTSLNPTMTIGRQIYRNVGTSSRFDVCHRRKKGLSNSLISLKFPILQPVSGSTRSSFPGGMRQRVMIAIALSCNPKILIADEPTTALDVTIQMQILQVVNELRAEMNMSVIWITHDLGVVAGMADRVIVMYGGRAVEIAASEDLFYRPQHPYSIGLLNSVPSIAEPVAERLIAIEGLPPDLSEKRDGCSFYPRCALASDICKNDTPRLETKGNW